MQHQQLTDVLTHVQQARTDEVKRDDLLAEVAQNLQKMLQAPADRISIEIYQQDWIPGWAAFRDDGAVQAEGKAHVVLNVGSLMCAVREGDISHAELPYVIAESLMHEVVHVLEAWAGVEFSEERVHAITEKYQALYGPQEKKPTLDELQERAQRNFHCTACQVALEYASGSLMDTSMLKVAHTCEAPK